MLKRALAVGVLGGAFPIAILSTSLTAASEATAQRDDRLESVVSCAELRVPAVRAETNTVLDLETHLITMDITGADGPFTIDYTDPVCTAHPVLGPIIRHVLDSAREDIATECAAFRAGMAAGRVVARGVELDPVKVQRYLDRWCTADAIP